MKCQNVAISIPALYLLDPSFHHYPRKCLLWLKFLLFTSSYIKWMGLYFKIFCCFFIPHPYFLPVVHCYLDSMDDEECVN
jgi:hypothetical protein